MFRRDWSYADIYKLIENIMRNYFAIGLLMALMGCETTDYRGRCNEYGFLPGTDAYAQCVQRLDMSDKDHLRRAYPPPAYGVSRGDLL